MKRLNLTLGALLTASVAFAAPASATSIVQSLSYGPAQTDYSGASLTPSLSLFNSALGTLNQVVLTFSYGYNSTITVTNNSADSGSSGDVFTKSGLQYSSGSSQLTGVLNTYVNTQGTLISGANTLSPVAFKLLGSDVGYTLAAGASTNLLSNASTASGNATITSGSDLSAFIGTGSVAMLLNSLTSTSLSNTGGNTSASQLTYGTATLTVEYDYTSPPVPGVPEPASLALLGAGLVGMGVIGRRGKKA